MVPLLRGRGGGGAWDWYDSIRSLKLFPVIRELSTGDAVIDHDDLRDNWGDHVSPWTSDAN